MGKSSNSAPPPPDPVATANAQTASNQQTAAYNAGLSHVDQYTPYGSLTYKNLPANPDGSPHYASTINFTPTGQAIFDQQQQQDKQVNGIANGYMGQIQDAMGKGLDMSGMPQLQSSANGGPIQSSLNYSGTTPIPGGNDFSKDAQNYQNAYFERMGPQLQRESDALDTQLANQGIMPGSQAWQTAKTQFAQQENDANSQAVMGGYQTQAALNAQQLAAHEAGVSDVNTQGQFANQAQNQGFNQSLQNSQLSNSSRAQALSEALQQRELPLNEFNSLRSASQVQTPSFNPAQPVAMSPTDISGNIYKSYQGLQDGYNQGVGSNNALMSGLFNLGGQLGAAYISS